MKLKYNKVLLNPIQNINNRFHECYIFDKNMKYYYILLLHKIKYNFNIVILYFQLLFFIFFIPLFIYLLLFRMSYFIY